MDADDAPPPPMTAILMPGCTHVLIAIHDSLRISSGGMVHSQIDAEVGVPVPVGVIPTIGLVSHTMRCVALYDQDRRLFWQGGPFEVGVTLLRFDSITEPVWAGADAFLRSLRQPPASGA